MTGKIVLERRAIDFAELVRRTIGVFQDRETEHRIEIATESVWVEGDPVRIEQIVSNIISNAVKYTPSGGKIRVSLQVESDEAVLRVRDSGFGIAPELLPRIFDLFVQGERTLERAQGGLGIGLTLVRRLVALHDGTVVATSEGLGRGSEFTVRLPQIPPARSAASQPDSQADLSASRRRVLIVEDNHDAREMFRMMLELSGHEVIEAEEGCAGLELLLRARPDVAFIDVGLPGIDGYEIARRFRRESPAVPADVLLSRVDRAMAHPKRSGAVTAALGFDHHLIKPVNRGGVANDASECGQECRETREGGRATRGAKKGAQFGCGKRTPDVTVEAQDRGGKWPAKMT